MIDKSFVQIFGQNWPIFAFVLAVALLKILLPNKKAGRKKRGPSTRAGRSSKPIKSEEDVDYERRLAGVAGELKIRIFVEKRFSSSLHDIYLPSNNGVTQIDHIILVGGAIVVIETKNYGGLILGDEKGHKWTQVMAGGNARNAFMNPIHQNSGHVSAVKLAIGDDASVPVRNLVVFVGDAKFGRPPPENVIVLGDLASKLVRITEEYPVARHIIWNWRHFRGTSSRLCGTS